MSHYDIIANREVRLSENSKMIDRESLSLSRTSSVIWLDYERQKKKNGIKNKKTDREKKNIYIYICLYETSNKQT